MNNIKLILYEVIVPVILAIVFIMLFFLYATLSDGDTFNVSYQSVIQDKYNNLINENKPKIIIVGGSSAGFGIDEDLLEKETGYEVVNLGLHAGFHALFNTEISKANINEGDIVLLGYEYGWHTEGYFSSLGVDLVMSGVGSKIEMYRHIPIGNWPELIGYLPDYCKDKASYQGAAGVYSRESFDECGSMNLEREFALQEYKEKIDVYGVVDITNVQIADDTIAYLKGYKEYVLEQGADIYFIAPPLYEEAIICDYQWFDSLVQQTDDKIGVDYISNPNDYFYSDEYIFDSIYHCTSVGETVRTTQLATDLRDSNIIKR